MSTEWRASCMCLHCGPVAHKLVFPCLSNCSCIVPLHSIQLDFHHLLKCVVLWRFCIESDTDNESGRDGNRRRYPAVQQNQTSSIWCPIIMSPALFASWLSRLVDIYPPVIVHELPYDTAIATNGDPSHDQLQTVRAPEPSEARPQSSGTVTDDLL